MPIRVKIRGVKRLIKALEAAFAQSDEFVKFMNRVRDDVIRACTIPKHLIREPSPYWTGFLR